MKIDPNFFVKCVKNKTIYKKEEIEGQLKKGNTEIIKNMIEDGYSVIIDCSTPTRYRILFYNGMTFQSIEHGAGKKLPTYNKVKKYIEENAPDCLALFEEIASEEKLFFEDKKRKKPYISNSGKMEYFDSMWDNAEPTNVPLAYNCIDTTRADYLALQNVIKDFAIKESYYLDVFVTLDQRDINRNFPKEV